MMNLGVVNLRVQRLPPQKKPRAAIQGIFEEAERKEKSRLLPRDGVPREPPHHHPLPGGLRTLALHLRPGGVSAAVLGACSLLPARAV